MTSYEYKFWKHMFENFLSSYKRNRSGKLHFTCEYISLSKLYFAASILALCFLDLVLHKNVRHWKNVMFIFFYILLLWLSYVGIIVLSGDDFGNFVYQGAALGTSWEKLPRPTLASWGWAGPRRGRDSRARDWPQTGLWASEAGWDLGRGCCERGRLNRRLEREGAMRPWGGRGSQEDNRESSV